MQIIPDPIFSAAMMLPFFVAVAALYALLVQPMIAWLDARGAAIGGARHDAKHLHADAEHKLAAIEAQLAQARAGIVELKAAARERGGQAERAQIDAARKVAEGEIEQALASIQEEQRAARVALREQIRGLAADVAGRVLGRGPTA